MPKIDEFPFNFREMKRNRRDDATVYTMDEVELTIARVSLPQTGRTSTGWKFREDTTPDGEYTGVFWNNPGINWDADRRTFGGPYPNPGKEGDRVRARLSISFKDDGKVYRNVNDIAILESASSDAGGTSAPSASSEGSPATSAPVEQRILQGMAFNNLTAMLAAPESSGDVLKRFAQLSGQDPVEVWAQYMTAAAAGDPLPLVMPVEVATADTDEPEDDPWGDE